ncbi:tetratricopeptide repeat protein [Micromonospora sp. PLK6-60]|uniref:tetratricopeptide repeat protein n=1 Tax=Micromonospora sp. PLK6-60 TaxID=2873383 RepID=UPI001CA7109E|nr:tetratricopeptide repeat protein [Micromonospora sp. PLK6-60]MBY8874672.1 tetratricopeptide repeat protein [Micromonospora sp. PLK6-60]
MHTRVDSRQLRRHVVRIERTDTGAVLGTGFFVAPGWVLTAAHVVYDHVNRMAWDQVRVVPADRDVGVDPVDADVLARSAPPATGSALWPYPDLAVLRLHATAEWVATHPCVWLSGGQPLNQECHAFGFPRREEGVDPRGAPASFTFEGVTGDEYFQLKAGQAAPGLSGAPLVCPTLRAVVGVVTATRDKYSDLGGWAAPLAALLSGGPGVPDELVEYGRQLASAGSAAVLANRATWHAVLPIDGADDLVEQPWTHTHVQPGTGQPSTMLRPEFAVVDYLFRGDTLATVAQWCDGPQRLSVRYIDASGGSGKTRFAVEACRAQHARGWIAGLLPADDRSVDTLPLPRLLVVDYVEERDASALSARLAALSRSASALAPVRLLLLSRPAAGALAGQSLAPLTEAASGAALAALDTAVDTTTAVADLTREQRRALFATGLSAFGHTWHGAGWTPPTVDVDLSDLRYGRPLDVLLEAFDVALSGPHWKTDGRPPVDRALVHEARRWYARLPALDHRLVRLCVALATLAGARDEDEAQALLDLMIDPADPAPAPMRSLVDRWLRGLYDGPDRWNPLRPDRLGEALVGQVLEEQNDHGSTLLASVLALRSDEQVQRALDVLVRLATTPAVAEVAATTLAGRYAELVQRCARQTRGGHRGAPTAADQPSIPRPSSTGLLDSLCRAHTALLTSARVAGLPITVRSQLIVACDALGALARDYGRSADASAIFTTVLAIVERLAASEPGNTDYARALSVAYNKLGDQARDNGQTDPARQLYQQSLGIAERLASTEPDNTTYARDLAISYNKLGDLAAANGQTDQARQLHQQSLAIAERLASTEPDNTTYARDLAISYERLGDLAAANGQTDQARQLHQQSLTIRERLVTTEPDDAGSARDLAISYNKVGDIARASGQTDQARQLYQQSLAIAERLVTAEPDNTGYTRDLAVSYNKLGDLAAANGLTDQARQLHQQSLAIAERLASTEPDNTTYARDLAISYERLGDLAAANGQTDQARQLHQQSLTIRERLVTTEPDNTSSARALAISYNKVGDIARASGQTDQARHLYQQSLAIAERLATIEPGNTSYARDLSISYERLGDLAATNEQTDQARQLHQQSLTIREQLISTEPDNPTYARDLSVSYNKLGDHARANGQTEQARQLHQQSLTIAERLATTEPENTTYARDLSVSYNKLGDLAADSGQLDQARQLYQQSLSIHERLSTIEPENTTYARDLAISCERLGVLAQRVDDVETAEALLTRAADTRRALHRQEPDRADFTEELGVTLALLAGIITDDARAAVLAEAVGLLAAFEEAGTLTPKGAAVLRWLRQ